MNDIDPDKTLRRTVTVTRFRRNMAHYIAAVRYGDDWLRIKRKGTDPVYLVSETDFRLICEAADELHDGPRDPKSGMRTGRGFTHWVRAAFKADRTASEAEGATPPAPRERFEDRMAAAQERMQAKKDAMKHDVSSPEERRARIADLLASAEARIAEVEAAKAAGLDD